MKGNALQHLNGTGSKEAREETMEDTKGEINT